MKWITENAAQITTGLGGSISMAGILYLAIIGKLDTRYITKKQCEKKEADKREISKINEKVAESRESVTNVMLKSLKEDVGELKETNKTIFEKLDKITYHLINNKVA